MLCMKGLILMICRVIGLLLLFVGASADAGGDADQTCRYDYDMIQRAGSTSYGGDPIQILGQSASTVQFTVGNTWTTGGDTLDQVFVSYPANAVGDRKCYLDVDVSPGTSIGTGLKAFCGPSGVAMVRIYVRDSSFDASTDSAKIPSDCSDLATGGNKKPALEYLSVLNCLPTCNDSDHDKEDQFEIQYPTDAPTQRATSFSCPEPGGELRPLPPYVSGELIELGVSTSDSLCTLVEVNSGALADPENLELGLIPVARSYSANDWEVSPGKYSSIDVDCSVANSCTVSLPILGRDRSFALKTFRAPALSDKNEKARFLEKTTFGPTKAEIDGFGGASAWVAEQFNMDVTSHRAFFREHLTQWFYETSYHTLLDTHACQQGARYRKYTFHQLDRYRTMQIKTSQIDSSKVILSVDGQIRSLVNGPLQCGDWSGIDETIPALADGDYNICRNPLDSLEGWVKVSLDGGVNCNCNLFFGGVHGNPPVYFDSNHSPDFPILELGSSARPILEDTFYFTEDKNQLLQLTTDLTGSECDSISAVTTGAPDVVRVGRTVNSDGISEYWIHSTSFRFVNNEIDTPILDGGKSAMDATADAPYERMQTKCASAPRTFLNEDSCVLSDNACYGREGPDVVINLNRESLEKIHKATGGAGGGETRYVYAVRGLRFDTDSLIHTGYPCGAGTRSRWIRVETTSCDNAKAIGPTTKSIFSDLLENLPNDANENIRDIFFPQGSLFCDKADRLSYGFKILLGGVCWENVHPDNYQVYDFTYWTTDAHPGNVNENKIKAFADGEEPTWNLTFPSWHTMDRWHDNMENFPNVGRLGDNTTLKSLPAELFREDIAQAFGSYHRIVAAQRSVLVCGSPFEVATVIDEESGPLDRGGFSMHTRYNFTRWGREAQRTSIWMKIAQSAKDQLRQRVAFALSQVIPVSPDSIGGRDLSESFLVYYDIFVRNAFGNYYDVLKEVTYNPLMAEMLTYKDGGSTGYSWGRHWSSSVQSPDENYAREIMQLFTIGMHLLKDDGTLQLDDNGNPILTYTNVDIAEYAKVYTGFSRQSLRSNIEEPSSGNWRNNQVDPMRIDAIKKDHLPKLGLNRQYIGDGIPLCSDLPSHQFLKIGARFRLLGSISDPDLLNEPTAWHEGPPKRISLDHLSSTLSAKICGGDANACDPPITYTLEEDISCVGVECVIFEPRTLEVAPGIWYEYVRPPCVNLAFYQNPKTIFRRWYNDRFMCANPINYEASTLCCNSTYSWDRSVRDELFSGERVDFDTAVNERCSNEGVRPCNGFAWISREDCARKEMGGCDSRHVWYWSKFGCTISVKVNRVGAVAIIHAHGLDEIPDGSSEYMDFRFDTKSFFRADWESDEQLDLFLSDYDKKCTSWGGTIDTSDGLCQFPIAESTSQLFNSDSEVGSINNVLSKAKLGAVQPRVSGEGVVGVDGIMKFPTGQVSPETIFEFADEYGRKHRRKNVISKVFLGNGKLKMRNPVTFHSSAVFTERDAMYELDETLKHFFYHQNMAPFIVIRLSQRFGISNPSPRYIQKAANAFRTGTYESFGSQKYGCLKATIAALLLDREFLDPALDVDPTQGSVREPFLKLAHLMRSLNFETDPRKPFFFLGKNLQDAMGQEPHKLPNVFSFFKPEFAPGGKIRSAGLMSPESQVLNGPTSVAMANLMLSFVKYGANSCYGGIGGNNAGIYGWATTYCNIGSSTNWGMATYNSSDYNLITAEAVVDDLATLLTSGRLSERNRQLMVEAYDYTMSQKNNAYEAMVNVQQLMVLSPEFQTTSTPELTGKDRVVPGKGKASGKPYKAVVYLMLEGGMDSYNMLVPKTCSGRNDDGVLVSDQYLQQRGELAFNGAREFGLTVSASGQPCSEFAIHDELKIVKELYDSGDLVWVANSGVVNQNSMTSNDFNGKTRTQLFSHNGMQEETKKVDPYDDVAGTGVLGRANDILSKSGHVVSSMNVDESAITLSGVAGAGPSPLVISSEKIDSFGERPDGSKWWARNNETYFDIEWYANKLNGGTSGFTGFYGDQWSGTFIKGIGDAIDLKKILEETSVMDPKIWGASDPSDWDERRLTRKFQTAARLMQTHESRNTDREAYSVIWGNFDHHSNMKAQLRSKLKVLNRSLEKFVKQLKQDGLWKDTVIYVTSEFGRTMTPNQSGGSDHAWAQHVMVMGGPVKGGRVLGKYPNDVTPKSPLETGTQRGRFLPTISNDAIWNSILKWYGVTDEKQLDHCLPNRKNTVNPVKGEAKSPLLELEDMF